MAMKIEIRNESVHISGYVNAVDRFSRPIKDRKTGAYFIEKIMPGTFRKAIEDAEDILVMLNHETPLTSVKSGGITLKEDNIGLYFEGDITDSAVLERAKEKRLKGWSFGFTPICPEDCQSEKSGISFERTIRSMKLYEVSIIDDTRNPCYPATSIHARADEGENGDEIHQRADGDGIDYVEENKNYFANELRKRKLSIKKRK